MTDWLELARGTDCPFDAHRADGLSQWDLVARFRVSSLYLNRNQTYRGHCVLVLDLRHATRPDELSPQEWAEFCGDLHHAERAIVRAVRPDHVNIAALGNVMPHLHWHIIPRYRSDPRWGEPIWPETVRTALEPAEHQQLRDDLRHALGTSLGTGSRGTP
jgi:diadenosine tetraphosphate (Ap4A) HIT family hydrolase